MRERGDLLAQQAHEVALARAPFAEQSERERHRRVPVGDHRREHGYVVANTQVVPVEWDALRRIDQVLGDATGKLEWSRRRRLRESLVPELDRFVGPRGDRPPERLAQLWERDAERFEQRRRERR